jgi:hypothetical protein
MINPELPELDLDELRKKGRELDRLRKLKEAELQTFKTESKTKAEQLKAELQAFVIAVKEKQSELQTFEAAAKTKTEQLKAEIESFAKEYEAIGARFETLMDAKNERMSKRITPYMPPGTATN